MTVNSLLELRKDGSDYLRRTSSNFYIPLRTPFMAFMVFWKLSSGRDTPGGM